MMKGLYYWGNTVFAKLKMATNYLLENSVVALYHPLVETETRFWWQNVYFCGKRIQLQITNYNQ